MDDWDSDIVPPQYETAAERRFSKFCNAAHDGDVQLMESMLQKKQITGVDEQSPKKRETALHYACRGGSMPAIQYLVEQGANITLKDTRGKHAFHLSCSGGHLEAVKYLIQHGAPLDFIDKYNRSCLHWAAVNRHKAVVEALLNAGAPLTYKASGNWQPIHSAVKGGDVEILNIFLEKGALQKIEMYIEPLWSPLHIAAREDHFDCLQALIKYKHPVNVVNKGKKTPLHEAAFKGSANCCQQLLLSGSDPHAKDNLNRNALSEACQKGNLLCALYLLDAGSKVNEQGSSNGASPLRYLLSHNHETMERGQLAHFTDVLLQYGANPNCLDADGETPLYIAKMYHLDEVLDVIRRYQDNPFTLKHMAKIGVRKMVGCDYEDIQNLDLPVNLKAYIWENYSYYLSKEMEDLRLS